jgi:hypothetical protein
MVAAVREWIRATQHMKPPGANQLWKSYNSFTTYFNEYGSREGFSVTDLEAMNIEEFIEIARAWLVASAAALT